MAHIIRIITAILSLLAITSSSTQAIRWQHSTYLDENFRLLWNLNHQAATITIEVQVRTHGYVGIGFARPASTSGSAHSDRLGADVTIGWVARGQTHLQDRHFRYTGSAEPRIDASDDSTLLLGYENATHTVLRFQRPLDTCDQAHDVRITNHTMRVLFMYHASEPHFGRFAGAGSLPHPAAAFRGIVPLQLAQRAPAAPAHNSVYEPEEQVQTMELRNEDVPLPAFGESLRWCRVFEITDFRRKHHMVRYEPLIGSATAGEQLDQITLYECQGSSPRLAAMARDAGRPCAAQMTSVPCNAIVASWTRGSAGLQMPKEAGIPMESGRERFYLMESHYRNEQQPNELVDLDSTLTDDSGLLLHVTSQLRRHDAGVLSVGMQPDWRHIIPPGQETVTSEGHCVDSCTRSAFGPKGINIFAVLMQGSRMAKSMRLRQVRQHEELVPIATDAGVHSEYAEYRHVEPAARVLPGDRMVVECTYDSQTRDTLTLGSGMGARAAACQVLAVYYPRQKKLTSCHSLPSLPTVLHSLGIEELADATQPVLIAAPLALAGQTLESRLLGYDWAQNFGEWERVTRAGSFQAVCTDARHKTVLGSDRRLYHAQRVQRVWREQKPARKCHAELAQESTVGEEEEFSMSNTVDGEPSDSDAYEVLSMGYSSGAAERSASIVGSCAALFVVAMLRMAFVN